jgi:tRNA dimethylallyltransferase
MRPRQELYERVDQRIKSMFEKGLLNEVQTLLDKGYAPALPTMSAIGYRECVAVLQGAITLDEAKTQIKKLTRIFVRRQGNWFKENDPQIRWFEMGEETTAEVENYLRKKLSEENYEH